MSRNFKSVFNTALATGAALAALCCAGFARPDAPKKVQSPEQVLHEFLGGTDGETPTSALLADQAGNFYGTADYGGDVSCKLQRKGPKGCGVVYKITSGGSVSILHAFTDTTTDGGRPGGGYLASDASGNLYGTTGVGGANGFGTIFELAPDGTETVLHSFPSTLPYPADLLRDAQGNLYGLTNIGGGTGCGGQGCGAVFELAPDGTFAVLYAFTGGADGANPLGALAIDGSGNIYGTTQSGAAPATAQCSKSQLAAGNRCFIPSRTTETGPIPDPA